MTPDEVYESPAVEARAYFNQPVWKRIVVIAAGPGVNLLIAFVIFWGIFLSQGHWTTGHGWSVAAIERGTPAARVLVPGDQILSIGGARTEPAMVAAIKRHRCAGPQVNGCLAATPVTFVVLRDGHRLTLHLRPRYDAARRRPLVGFDFGPVQLHQSVGPVHAAALSADWLWHVTGQTVSTIVHIFQPKERSQLHGIVGAYEVTAQSISSSASTALQVIGLISLSLAVINMFPFLPLDGGHIFWALAEKVRGRQIPFSVMVRAGMIGFALILLLFAIGLSNDISTLSGKGFTTP